MPGAEYISTSSLLRDSHASSIGILGYRAVTSNHDAAKKQESGRTRDEIFVKASAEDVIMVGFFILASTGINKQ